MSFDLYTLRKLEEFIDGNEYGRVGSDEEYNVLTVERYPEGGIADAYWICVCGKRIRFGELHILRGTPNQWKTPVRLCGRCWRMERRS